MEHNRKGSESYFLQRKINFIPVAVLDEAPFGMGKNSMQTIEKKNPFYRDYAHMPLFASEIDGKWIAYRTPDPGWAIQNFGNIKPIKEN